MGTQGNTRRMIKADLKKGLQLIGIPFMEFKKGEETLRFLLDTGASYNFIRREVIETFSPDVSQRPSVGEYFGIDNVTHETQVCDFSFKILDYNYSMEFHTMDNADALNFDVNGETLKVHGLLGTPFFYTYGACFSYETMEMYFYLPEEE